MFRRGIVAVALLMAAAFCFSALPASPAAAQIPSGPGATLAPTQPEDKFVPSSPGLAPNGLPENAPPPQKKTNPLAVAFLIAGSILLLVFVTTVARWYDTRLQSRRRLA
jgi:hypothetical protein